MSSPSPLHQLATQNFDEHYKQKQSESFVSQPSQSFENPIFTFGCFSLKAVYNSCKLQRLLQVAKFLFMYSFTHTNIVFLFRHLPTEIVIFINVCYQMKCFSGDSFSFFRSRFCQYSTYFFDFMWSSNKVFKECSEQYIRDHLSGTKVSIWIYFKYDAGFDFSCIALCNLTKSFTFSFLS